MDYKETQGNVGVVCYLDFGDGFTSLYIHIHSTGAIRHMHNICIMENRLITASQDTQKKSFGIKTSRKLLSVMGNNENCFK